MTEPYQRGKIPVVFIHGMYSDPVTWVETLNELKAQRDLYDRYQFWLFRYPTGGAVLESAADLRTNWLPRDRPRIPSTRIRRSMRWYSWGIAWAVCYRRCKSSTPTICCGIKRHRNRSKPCGPASRCELGWRDFFFEPLPFVTRVVFVGTPHRGSAWSNRLAGRLGSSLVRFGATESQEYRQVIETNRDVFRPYILRLRPTSVNFLEPSNPFLIAINEMPVNPEVRLHSIIGTGKLSPVGEPGDGVVDVYSVCRRGVESELYVPAQHEKLHRDPESIAEMARILREHANELASRAAPQVTR